MPSVRERIIYKQGFRDAAPVCAYFYAATSPNLTWPGYIDKMIALYTVNELQS